ncbi:squalene cyclase [Silvibacterium dinghuense]|uniref:Squalene cyclase n=1 Tax=Silvibacterium dinghuense TaxID=1560006 RepID=A0A4Q1S8U2_9BACT|nr:squalene cyclase [Silvibacterium dinghuense]RXS93417.1 squalene cyclase [Silvibacterium dinghuense]GGH05631.1 hypothetical protein GCM10011586_22280 [Silvibacterium dinghuense]
MVHHDQEVLAWLLDSDPAIRWQVMHDLLEAPDAACAAERARIETEGWGARLLSLQDADGQWAGGAFVPAGFTREEWKTSGQPWTATCYSLNMLREFGLDPKSESAQRTIALVGQNCHWDEGGQPFWHGETEECINGRTVADGAYFGADISGIVARLLGEQQPDGGWNCERANGSACSSFASTLNVLEGLLAYEQATGGTAAVSAARRSGEAYLLQRHLYRRLSTGQTADERFLALLHPSRWRYDILRALDYFRAASLFSGSAPDPRLGEAIEHLRSKRRSDGKWAPDWSLPGRIWFPLDDGIGHPSRWITLRAMRVLQWWDAARPS